MIRSAIVGLMLLAPNLASASEIRVASYEMNETGGMIVLESDSPIGEPWTRLAARSAKIWFPDLTQIARFEHARDEREPIRALQLRPGAGDSAVLEIDLGGGRRMTRDNLQVIRSGHSATIKIDFPAPARANAVQAPSAASAKPSTAVSSAPVQVTEPVAATQPAPVSASAAAPAAGVAAPKLGTRPAAALADASGGKSGLGLATAPSGHLGVLIVVSLVLAGIYAFLRTYNKKRRPARAPDIEVLSARRLGHRQELLVVRALGADHLLLSSGGRIERVASVPTGLPLPAPSEPALPLPVAPAAEPEADTQATGLEGIITKLSPRSRIRRLLDAVEQEQSETGTPADAPAARSGKRPAFGPELMGAMQQHKLTELSALPPARPRQSEAVAGIARLRNRAPN